MICKKEPHNKCLCAKRKHGGCAECEKNAIETVQKSGRDINGTIKFVKESGEIVEDLYVNVRDFDADEIQFWYRSAIDILRGVCKYCKQVCSKACSKCMWSNGLNGDDYWLFDERFLLEHK